MQKKIKNTFECPRDLGKIFRYLILNIFFLSYMTSFDLHSQLPTIDGHFCDSAIWGTPAGSDSCNDANPPTADMGNLYLIDQGDQLYVGWQRCTNGSGTSTFTIRFDSDCDGREDSYIYIEWDAIGSNCSSIEPVFVSDGSNSVQVGEAIQGSFECNGNNPNCSESGKFVEWVLDMSLVTEALIDLNLVDPCSCDCETISLLDAVTLSGGSLTSSPKDNFDFFSFDYEYELNDCPDSDFTHVDESCINEELQFDGTITIDVSPLADTLYYNWNFGDGSSSTDSMPTHTYASPGTYTVTLQVEDKFGCSDQISYPIKINPAINTQCSFISDVTCRGFSDGSASVRATGGNGNYIYTWDNGEDTQTAISLATGLHSVTVSDANGCSHICQIEISEPPNDLSCSAIENEPARCVDEQNGVATILAAGGNGGYTYLWDNDETTATASALGAGIHTVTVTDSKDCQVICTVEITQPDAKISCSTRQLKPVLCYGESNGSASVNVTGGNGANIFEWDNGETTRTANALTAGFHSVTVSDRKGCQSQCVVLIEEPEELTCTISEDQAVSCFGNNDGGATVTVSGGTSRYFYEWDNGERKETVDNLTTGLHYVTVTDFNDCTTVCSIVINGPTEELSCTASEDNPVSCNGEANGEATITPTGSNGGYTFLWDNGETTATATGLDAGLHTVVVTDSKECTTSCTVTINEPSAELTCSVSEDNPVECYGESNGQATVSPIGGNGDYTYLWDNGETTATATALNAGLHSVVITDSKNCTTSCTVTINEPSAELTCSAAEVNPVSCNGDTNGQATVSPNGGNGDYTYLWDNGETTATATGLSAGVHNVVVTDSKDCTTSCTVTINEPSVELTCSASEDNPVVCNGDANGGATVTPTGGNGGYTYLWDNNEITQTATALSAGLHSVTVFDSQGCSSVCTVMINEPSESIACSAVEDSPVVCSGESNGQTTVTVNGGNGGYTYLWDNNETTQTATALSAGLHSVIVTDSQGCSSSCSITINEPTAAMSCSAIEDKPVDCKGESNGAATVTAFGGNGSYTYNWDNGETTATASALDSGIHTVTVTDSKNCSTICSITINEPQEDLSCTIFELNPVVCKGESNGQATVTPIGGNGGYSYLWDNGVTTATATNLGAGPHTVTVTDSKNCATTCDIIINEPSNDISCSIMEDNPVVCKGESNGEATVTATGGNGGYTYLWDNGETTAFATALNAGPHTVTITDSKDCTSTCSITINEPDTILTCSAVEDAQVICKGEANGQATVTPVGGNGGYIYLWDNGETTATAIALNVGVHNVTITDSKGCSTNCSVTITEPSETLSCEAVEDNPVLCNDEANGEATVTPIGGNGGYTYLWDNGETTATAISLIAGIHTVTVTDDKNCTSICQVEITQPDSRLECTAEQDEPVNCKGEANGQATVKIKGGNGGDNILWDNGETTNTAVALDAGFHTVTVIDSKGCETQCIVLIEEPEFHLTCNASEDNPVVCRGESNGEATVTPAGGNDGYTYLWDNGETTATAVALDAGTHTVVVTDSKNCTTSCSITINEPSAELTCSSIEINPVVCKGESNGEATVTPAGGNGGYAYLWDNGETTATATTLDAGIHTVVVTDSKDCTTSCTITINEPSEILTCTATEINPVICKGEANGEATVIPTGGNGGYTYLWDNGETTATATALDAGAHTVVVTDSKNCTTSCSVTINEPSAELTCSAIEINPVVCKGESNGEATVTPAGGNGGYTYLWDNGETTATATTLNAGNHTVTVRDSKNCTTTCSVIITEPSAPISCTVVGDKYIDCDCGDNGHATVTAIGGNGNYNYLWSNGETTQQAVSLGEGSHSVLVTDSKGCQTLCTINMEIDPGCCFDIRSNGFLRNTANGN